MKWAKLIPLLMVGAPVALFAGCDQIQELIGGDEEESEDDDEAEAGTEDDLQDQIAALNTRARGRHFRIPDFKANLLKRRWEDILKPEAGADED